MKNKIADHWLLITIYILIIWLISSFILTILLNNIKFGIGITTFVLLLTSFLNEDGGMLNYLKEKPKLAKDKLDAFNARLKGVLAPLLGALLFSFFITIAITAIMEAIGLFNNNFIF